MSYNTNISKNPKYILNKDIDNDSNRFDQYEMYYLGKEYIIFANTGRDAREQSEIILEKLQSK
jgi:hypothetical protein